MTSPRSTPDSGESRTGVVTDPGLAVAAVARRLGVAPATLRTWDRRYGLGPSEHQAGSHRRYTKEDIARLLIMRQLTLEGVAPVDAAKAALAADDERLAQESTDAPVTESRDSFDLRPATEESSPPARPNLRVLPSAQDASAEISRSRHAVRPQGPRSVSISDVVDAAIAYDQDSCTRLLRLQVGDDPGGWWSELVEPALDRLAERTVLAGPGEVPEMVLATATLAALREYAEASEEALVSAGGPPRNHPSRMRRIVLVFAAPDEPLPLAAHALAAALSAHGAMARIVTGPANVHRTLELVMMVRPTAIAMVTNQAHPDLGVVRSVHEANPDLSLFVGLPQDDAAAQLPLAPTVQRVRSFTGLLYELLAVVR